VREKQELFVDRIDTAIGEMILVADPEGNLRAIDWVDYEARMLRLLQRQYRKRALVLKLTSNPNELSEVLRRYFAGDVAAIDHLPVAAVGTPFQREVWQALRAIPAGTTCSYGELAKRIGRPRAVRAVGMANGSNPIGIVVPCHRVIGANGLLTGYGGGMERKRWLLDHESDRARHDGAPIGHTTPRQSVLA
jgi:methylated-DNA-[protein]-cysteine S-methyltransferase